MDRSTCQFFIMKTDFSWVSILNVYSINSTIISPLLFISVNWEEVLKKTIFFFNRHCNPCGFLPAQLSLSILSTKVFTECRCQRHIKPHNLEDQWLECSNSCHQVSLTPETMRANPSSGRWNYGREIAENFAESGDFHVTFWVLLRAVNLRHGTDGFTSPPKEGTLRTFSPKKSNGFGRVWTHELGYQRPAHLPLDHRSRY